MSTLFQCCSRVILASPYLLERASLHLPSGISYSLLHLALCSGNQLAVRKLVEKWPHADLKLDLVPEGSLYCTNCGYNINTPKQCLKPLDFMETFGNYGTHQIVSSFLEGVFYNIYYYSSMTDEERMGLNYVDMSYIIIDATQVRDHLLRLAEGDFPGIHHRDYISDNDAKKLRVSRPHLKTCKSNTRKRLILCVNILLKDTTSKKTIETLSRIFSQCQWVDVRLKGVYLLRLNSAVLQKFHLAFKALITPITELNESRFRYLVLYTLSEQSESIAATLSQLTIEPCRLRVFCCLLQRNADISKVVVSALSSFLIHSCEHLEYLQIQYWSLTLISLDALLQCSKLRVISIGEAKGEQSKQFMSRHSVEDVFTAVSQLHHLEYFQWSENINLTTAGLLCLHNLLSSSFKTLQHFHINFMYVLLSTTDLMNKTFSVLSDILVPLLNGKQGSEEVTTFRFSFEGIVDTLLDWLFRLRSNICFKLGQQKSYAIELLSYAVDCFFMPS